MTNIKLDIKELKTFRVDFEDMIQKAKRKLLIFNVNESVSNIKDAKYKKFTNAKDAFEYLNN